MIIAIKNKRTNLIFNLQLHLQNAIVKIQQHFTKQKKLNQHRFIKNLLMRLKFRFVDINEILCFIIDSFRVNENFSIICFANFSNDEKNENQIFVDVEIINFDENDVE